MRSSGCFGAWSSAPLCQAFSWQRFFQGWRPVASVGIEDEDETVFEGDLDRLAGFRAPVEQVEAWFPVVCWNPFADDLRRGSLGSMSKGGSGGGGMSMTPSQSPCSRRKNSISPGRKKVSTTFMVPLQHGHWSGSAPQTQRNEGRAKGEIAQAVTLGGGGMMGGFAPGCFSSRPRVSV